MADDALRLAGDPNLDAQVSVVCHGPPDNHLPAVFSPTSTLEVYSFRPGEGLDSEMDKLAKKTYFSTGLMARGAGNLDGQQGKIGATDMTLTTLSIHCYFHPSQWFRLVPDPSDPTMPTTDEAIGKNLRRRVVYSTKYHKLMLYEPTIHDPWNSIYMGFLQGRMPKGERELDFPNPNGEPGDEARYYILISGEKFEPTPVFFDPLTGDMPVDDMMVHDDTTKANAKQRDMKAISEMNDGYGRMHKVLQELYCTLFLPPVMDSTFHARIRSFLDNLNEVRRVFGTKKFEETYVSGWECRLCEVDPAVSNAFFVETDTLDDKEKIQIARHYNYPFYNPLGLTSYVSYAMADLIVTTLRSCNPFNIFNKVLALRYAINRVILAVGCTVYMQLQQTDKKTFKEREDVLAALLKLWENYIKPELNGVSRRFNDNITQLRASVVSLIIALEKYLDDFQRHALLYQIIIWKKVIQPSPMFKKSQISKKFSELEDGVMTKQPAAEPDTPRQCEYFVRNFYAVKLDEAPVMKGLGEVMRHAMKGVSFSSRMEWETIMRSCLFSIPWSKVEAAVEVCVQNYAANMHNSGATPAHDDSQLNVGIQGAQGLGVPSSSSMYTTQHGLVDSISNNHQPGGHSKRRKKETQMSSDPQQTSNEQPMSFN